MEIEMQMDRTMKQLCTLAEPIIKLTEKTTKQL